MPIRVRASSELGLVTVDFEGVVTTDEFEQLLPLLDDPVYNQMSMTIVDTTAAVRSDAPSSVIYDAASRAAENVDRHIGAGARLALVAENPEFFGLGRMYQILRDPSPVEVSIFGTADEAERWLGLPADYRARLRDVE